MNLREWKSISNDVKKLFQDDQMKESKIKVLSLHWNTMMDKMVIPTQKFDKLMIATDRFWHPLLLFLIHLDIYLRQR